MRGKLRETLRGFSSIVGGRTKLNMVAPLQEAALDEMCILVDELDRPLGEASKRHCHLVDERGDVPLHRAFSVFLFDTDDNLLLQKRAPTKVIKGEVLTEYGRSETVFIPRIPLIPNNFSFQFKRVRFPVTVCFAMTINKSQGQTLRAAGVITFPGHYTNSCCSHPLSRIPGETEEHLALGIKRAAQRRLHHELGIPESEVTPEEFNYLTRIHYQSAGDGKWGEHEIDYVLFLQKHNITLNPNPDEISEIRWVSKDSIKEFVESVDAPLTPWFHLILKHRLPIWWDHLDNLDKMQDHTSIQRFN